jgi:hypothetical protein
MKVKLLLFCIAALSVWLLFLDREWMFGRLRLYSAPVVLLILGSVLVASWLFGVILTRVLNLQSAEPFSVLGVGLVATAVVASTVTLIRIIWGRVTGSRA